MTATHQATGSRFLGWFRKPTGRMYRTRIVTVALAASAILSGLATYGSITGTGPFGPDNITLIVLLNIDLVLILVFGAIIVRRLLAMISQRRRGKVGARLQGRLVAAFSLTAAIPALLIGGASVIFFNFGINAWFDDKVRTAVGQSKAVAESYLKEQRGFLAVNAWGMARELYDSGLLHSGNNTAIKQFLDQQANRRGVSEWVVKSRGGAFVVGFLSQGLTYEDISVTQMDRADRGEVVLLDSEVKDRVRLMVPLRARGRYLLVGRTADRVLITAATVRKDAESYEAQANESNILQINYALFYIVAVLLLISVAVWVAVNLASRLVKPVTEIGNAAEKLGNNDLTVRVTNEGGSDELAELSDTFNRMASRIDEQHRSLDARRRFTESVLAGVSAGVIGLDAKGAVELANHRALELLEMSDASLAGIGLADSVPEFSDLLTEALKGRAAFGNVELDRGGQPRRLIVRIGSVRGESDSPAPRDGYVVTFDDITPRVLAERKAAWTDVAQRMAHEIKNPLTPITLASDRLSRKFGPQIHDSPEVFRELTDTIRRQVRKVTLVADEFWQFARMPKPLMKPEDPAELVRKAINLQRVAEAPVTFEWSFPDSSPLVYCDRHMIGSVLDNILKNAVEAFESAEQGNAPENIVKVTVSSGDAFCTIEFEDNGPGFPVTPPERLLEPHVTHGKADGHGLGLTIVRSFIEEQGGTLALRNVPHGGASVSFTLPLASDDSTSAEPSP